MYIYNLFLSIYYLWCCCEWDYLLKLLCRWSLLVLVQFSSVAQSCLTLRLPESQQARPPCPSQTPRVHSNSCPLSRWCHPAISSSVIPFSSCPQSLPVSGSFPMSQLFAWIFVCWVCILQLWICLLTKTILAQFLIYFVC